MQRFFLPNQTGDPADAIDLTPLQHQLTRVLRAQPGDQVVVLDNLGNERLAQITAIQRRSISGRVLAVRPAPAEPTVQVTLYQCALKTDKLEWVWQKATELGVATLAPVISDRAIVRPADALNNKRPRWEAILREAAEQSGRGMLPQLTPPMTLREALAQPDGLRLVAYEAATGRPGLTTALAQAARPVRAVSLLIGPEGGFTQDEVELAAALGWQVVSLGARTLRAETAALAALALILGGLGELGGAPPPSPAADAPPVTQPTAWAA